MGKWYYFPAELGHVDVEYHRVTVEINDSYARTRAELATSLEIPAGSAKRRGLK